MHIAIAAKHPYDLHLLIDNLATQAFCHRIEYETVVAYASSLPLSPGTAHQTRGFASLIWTSTNASPIPLNANLLSQIGSSMTGKTALEIGEIARVVSWNDMVRPDRKGREGRSLY